MNRFGCFKKKTAKKRIVKDSTPKALACRSFGLNVLEGTYNCTVSRPAPRTIKIVGIAKTQICASMDRPKSTVQPL